MNVENPTLQALVADRKGGRSYEQLAALSGGRLSRARIQQIATREMKAFPDAATLAGLARALDVPVQEVVLATARSLGLEVRGGTSGDALLVPGGKNLSAPAQDALLTMARELSKSGARNDERSASGEERGARVDHYEGSGKSHALEDSAAPHGVNERADDTNLARSVADDRPWEHDEYGLAAKRGRNRGREVREQQDREAENGGA